MSSWTLNCPSCSKPVSFGAYLSGQEVGCPSCAELILLPQKESTSFWESRLGHVLRWIGLLPGVVLGTALINLITGVVLWLGSSRWGNDTWFDLIWREIIAHGAMGYAIVFCSMVIAPRGKTITATVFAATVLFLSGFLLFGIIQTRTWSSLLGLVCLNIGSISMAVQAWTDPELKY